MTEKINFWEERYRAGQPIWDIGQPAPPFVDYFEGENAPPPGWVIVPGCGQGHDALYLAGRGFEVLGVDFAPAAIEVCRARASEMNLAAKASFKQANIFDLLPQYTQAFDYALEYTCFCAIPIARRPEYVELVRGLLKSGGLLVATFFTHGRPGGPPFDTNQAEIQKLFSPYFEILRLEPPLRSAPSRQGEETFGLLRRKL